MLTRLIRFAFIVACCAAGAATASADVKVKSRQTMQGQSYENTTYIKGKRQRSESADGQMITITQCDLRRDLQIMPRAQAYTVSLYDNAGDMAAATSADKTASNGVARKGGVITMTVTTKDTGERKQMFGYTARRIITTMTTEASPDACTPYKNRMETDGWYIDAAFQLTCDTERYKNYRPTANKAGCVDRFETKQLGAGKRGYAVWEQTRMFDETGKESMSFVNEVVELSNATLDAALFEIPSGYREVKDFSQAYAAMSSGGAQMNNTGAGDDEDASSNGASGMSANVSRMANNNSDASNAAVGAKREGVVRFGLVTVKTGAVGDGMNASELGAAVGNTLSEYLKGTSVELVRLEARLPSQIELEAKQKECDFIIYANVSHKKGGGGFGKMFGKSSGILAGAISTGVGHSGSTGAHVAGSVATSSIYTAASVSSNVKSKDEITLDINLQAPGGASPALTKQLKAKAKSDGEDIISLLVEQAAQAIMDAAR